MPGLWMLTELVKVCYNRRDLRSSRSAPHGIEFPLSILHLDRWIISAHLSGVSAGFWQIKGTQASGVRTANGGDSNQQLLGASEDITSFPSQCFDCKPRLEAPHPQERNQGLLPDPLYQLLLYHSHQDSPACLTCPSSVRAWASIGCKLPSMADGFNCF